LQGKCHGRIKNLFSQISGSATPFCHEKGFGLSVSKGMDGFLRQYVDCQPARLTETGFRLPVKRRVEQQSFRNHSK